MTKTAAQWFHEGEQAFALSHSADSGSEYRADLEAALSAFEEALRQDPGLPRAQHLRALCLGRLGRDEEAADAFVSALGLDAQSAELRLAAAQALAKTGRLEAALSEFDATLARAPGHPEALHGRASMLTRLRRDEAALAAWEQVLAQADNRALTLDGREVRVLTGDLRRVGALVTRAMLTSRLRRPGAAAAWRALLEEHGDALTGMSAPPVFLDALRSVPECREALEAWAAANPGGQTSTRLGNLFGHVGDARAALQARQRAVALEPLDGHAWFALGESLSAAERLDEAREAYQRALALDGPTLGAETRLEQLRARGA